MGSKRRYGRRAAPSRTLQWTGTGLAAEVPDGFTFDEIEGKLRRQAPFLDFAPLVSISAVTGLRATKVLDAAVAAADARTLRIPTGVLNRLIAEAVADGVNGVDQVAALFVGGLIDGEQFQLSR